MVVSRSEHRPTVALLCGSGPRAPRRSSERLLVCAVPTQQRRWLGRPLVGWPRERQQEHEANDEAASIPVADGEQHERGRTAGRRGTTEPIFTTLAPPPRPTPRPSLCSGPTAGDPRRAARSQGQTSLSGQTRACGAARSSETGAAERGQGQPSFSGNARPCGAARASATGAAERGQGQTSLAGHTRACAAARASESGAAERGHGTSFPGTRPCGAARASASGAGDPSGEQHHERGRTADRRGTTKPIFNHPGFAPTTHPTTERVRSGPRAGGLQELEEAATVHGRWPSTTGIGSVSRLVATDTNDRQRGAPFFTTRAPALICGPTSPTQPHALAHARHRHLCMVA